MSQNAAPAEVRAKRRWPTLRSDHGYIDVRPLEDCPYGRTEIEVMDQYGETVRISLVDSALAILGAAIAKRQVEAQGYHRDWIAQL